MWRHAALLPERVQAAPLAALRTERSTRRPLTRRCAAALHPAPSEAHECAQQPWRRPLSGSAAPASSSSGSGGDSPPTQAAAAVAAAGVELPAMVALGKFDALHKGHRALAAAAAQLGGSPWLVSFSGMADVLGWPARLPLVAPCDRRRVLASWAPYCEGRPPRERAIPFAEVRSMSPQAFVELLAGQLRVSGVVVGSNYRFGYRAAGTAELLQQLAPQHGMRVRVLRLVGSTPQPAGGAAAAVAAAAKHADGQRQQQRQRQQPQGQGQAAVQQGAVGREEARQAVSSSRVRHALAAGDVRDAADCLGRPYRLVASLAGGGASSAAPGGAALRLPAAALLNQPPRTGSYQVEACLVGADTMQQVAAPQKAVLKIDDAGLTLHGGGSDWLAARGAQHLVLDFL